MSSTVDLRSFCTTDADMPRLQVLENFKAINKMIRTNFMHGRKRAGLTDIERKKLEQADQSTNEMGRIMRKLTQSNRASPRDGSPTQFGFGHKGPSSKSRSPQPLRRYQDQSLDGVPEQLKQKRNS